MEPSSPLLYQTISERLSRMIFQGTFRSGERIPSVRKLSEQFQVSISTILEAYRLLEDRGIIEARPQSGFYVHPRSWQPPAEPKVSDPPSTPGDLFFGAKQPKTAKAYDMEDRVLLCSSFSKTLAPGYRVGWVAPGKRYKQEIERLKFVSSVATATLP